MKAGSNPRSGSMGLFRPSHWDGRGLHPYLVWFTLSPLLIAAVVIVVVAVVAR
jgi:hypothetical protein